MAKVVTMGAGLPGGSLSPASPMWAGLCVVLRPWWLLSELPAAVVRVTRRVSPGPPLGLAARWDIRVQPERSSGSCVLWAVERLAE